MIPVSNEYKRQLIAGNRNYVIKIPVFLEGNTTQTPDFTLTNENIWEQGVTLESATSGDGSFDIGSAIVGSLKVVINNISNNYSSYDFYNAKLVLWLGVSGDLDEHDEQVYYRIGFYVCDTPTYNGSLITLECLDNMTWFDVPFSGVTGITYPCTAGEFVSSICSHVGVILGTPQFPNYAVMQISEESGAWLADNDINCREALQYVAQKCCCYCKIDTAGELALTWYDKNAIIGITGYDGGTYNTNTTPYSDGDDVDGGSFNPWSTGDVADGGTFAELQQGAWLTNNYEMQVSTDDIVVTGCRVRNTSGKDEEKYDELWVDATLEQTHDRYVLVIENNPLIIASEAETVANVVGSILAGLPIRAFTSSSLSDFSYETGDMVTIIDFRGNLYHTWITRFTFTTNNSESFACGAESIRQRSETRFSEAAKTLAEAGENAKAQLTEYDQAQAAMNELAQEALGYNVYEYDVTGGGHVTWLYDLAPVDDTDPEHPLFPNANTVIMISGDGLFISKDHGAHYYEGLDANSGTAILNMIYAHGINCDWIHAGTLTLGGNNNQDGLCSVVDASNAEKVRLDNNGIYAIAGDIGGMQLDNNGIGGTQQSQAINSSRINANGTFGFAHLYGSSWTRLAFEANDNVLGLATAGSTQGGGGFDISGGAWGEVAGWIRWGWSDGQRSDGFYVSWYNGSDKRLKKNVATLAKDKVRKFFEKVNPIKFNYNKASHSDTTVKHYGIIAQDIEEILDEIGENNAYIVEDKKVLRKDDGGKDYTEDYKYVHYEEFHGWEMAAIKDLYEIVNAQQAEIAELKARLK